MINLTFFIALVFVFVRMLSFFAIVPVFFPSGTPATAKIAFAAILSYIILPGINYSNLAIGNNYQIIYIVFCEVATGLVMGYITNLCFFSVRMAGQLMDMQMGLSMLSMFDPTSNSNATFLEHILYWISLMIFFIVDGHHMLIIELINSFSVVKLGTFILNQQSITYVIKVFTEFFAIGLQIAIPIILIMLLTDLTMGLVARTVPQLNIMILGMPIKIVVGLTCFILFMPYFVKFLIVYIDKIPYIFKELYKFIPIMFIFASEDKTEEATGKKKSEARQKGQVAKSKEVNLTFTLLASTMAIAYVGAYAFNSMKNMFGLFLTNYLNSSLDYISLFNILSLVLLKLAMILLPMILPIMIFGIVSNYIQAGFLFTTEVLKPDIAKLNPISGFKRMFSARSSMELLKDTGIVLIVGYVGYNYVKNNLTELLSTATVNINSVPDIFKSLTVGIFFKITLIMIVISLADYIFQRRQYNKELKMTKQEVKEEAKQQEGDPQIKGKIRQKQRQMASRRMMSQVPDATVVVTNPTHIAIALRYAEGENAAPVVVAKGADYLALKIKQIAKENDVPIIENKPLARLMYQEVELDSEIPVEMYQAIAEILALVFKMKKER